MRQDAVIYQVDLELEAGIAEAFDRWLRPHVEAMLEFDGFEQATILSDAQPAAAAGHVSRSVQYQVASRAALERYLTHHAERMRQHGLDRFEGRFRASRRILPATPIALRRDPAATAAVRCRNCDSELTGQYCANCGQRDRHRMISLRELFGDFLDDLLDLDSRLWRSFIPLVRKPGFLTREYLAGRRVRYTPPVRMYLVLSLVFFLVASADTSFVGGDPPVQDSTVSAGADANGRSKQPVADPEAANPPPGSAEGPETAVVKPTGSAESEDPCQNLEIESDMGLLSSPAALATIQSICEKVTGEGTEAFGKRLVENLPAMMFLFLPLIALVQKILYLGSGRYYVEHLLFFLHFHSFYFAALTLVALVGELTDAIPLADAAFAILLLAVLIYAPIYLFKAMRVVYGQHWIVTFLKFCVLSVAYLASLTLTFALGVLFTALAV